MSQKFGRYEILEEIGQGGFAIVHRAHDTQLGRQVALKELRSMLLHDTEWVKRFRREARTIAHLDHPRIVTIHDVGEVEDHLFIVMRLINGPSLEELITERGRFPWSEAVEIITAVAEGLDYAHTQNILHRDLKPANILMDPERGPLLSDFGLAKLVGGNSMSMTASGSVVGTPHYIAPEVWEGQSATRQSDIYALGCILCEMLTGEKVFKGETPPSVMMAHFKPPALPKTWAEGVPSGVTDVLKTTLASNPADRYATVADMVRALIALPEIASQAGQADVVTPEQQDIVSPAAPTQVAELTPQPAAILMQDNLEGVEQIPSQASIPSETLSQTTTPSPHLPPLPRLGLHMLNFQKLEDTIADLPPKWHSFLKSLSMSVIILFMLAIVNLLTSSSPWFIWIALAAGILLTIRFVNLLFDDKKEPMISPPSVVQSPPPFDSTSTTTPLPAQESYVSPVTSDGHPTSGGQAATSPPLTSTSPSSVAPTPSQVVRARERRKRSGCMSITITLAGILLLLIVAICGFCSVFSNFINSTLPTVEVGPTLTENINVAVPDTSNTLDLSLKVSGGQFFLAPGAEKDLLVEGTVTYNIAQLKPKINTTGRKIRIYPEADIGLNVLTTEGLENTWDLKLASIPMELTIDAGGANAEIELGSLSLADLALTHGGGSFQLSFSEANQIKMKDLKFQGGASSTTLTGLANARAEDISFEGGAGDFTLDFSGELKNDIDVTLQGGLGSVTIIVPENTAAQISVGGTLSNVETRGAWQKSNDNEYILPGEGYEITIKAEIGFGTLKLRTSEN